jgi:hypothetical protein
MAGRPKGPQTKEVRIRLPIYLWLKLNERTEELRLPSMNKAAIEILDEFLRPKIASQPK